MLSLLLLSVFPAALLIAAANDLYEFKVPNWISIALFVAYLAAGPALGASASVMVGGLIAGAAALAAGFALFAFRIFGGGDAKLLAAIAPWIGVSGAAPALFNIAFAGGADERGVNGAELIGGGVVDFKHSLLDENAGFERLAGFRDTRGRH